MQVNAHSTADHIELIRTQLNTRQELQFKPKTGVTTSKPVTTYIPPSPENVPTTRATPAITTTAPRQIPAPPNFVRDGIGQPRPADKGTVEPGVDSKPSTQSSAKIPVVSDGERSTPGKRVQALLKDWSQSDSPFDFSGNGIVGASDLLMLLSRLGGGSHLPQRPEHSIPVDPARPSVKPADVPQTTAPSDQNPPATNRLDGLVADWGEKNSPFDLDGNGIVGASDLLMLLARLGGGGAQQPQEPSSEAARTPQSSSRVAIETPAPPNIPYGQPVTSSQSVAIGLRTTAIAQELIDKVGQNSSGTIAPPELAGSTQSFDRIDRNHDGAGRRSELASTVRDILLDHLAKNPSTNLHQFVQEAMQRLTDHGKADEAPSKRIRAVDRPSSVYQQANLKAIARQLMQGLTDYGAMELRKFVQEGELSANEKRTVLDQISRLRPGAQRVNLVG